MSLMLANNAASTLADQLRAGDTRLRLRVGTGPRFPVPKPGQWFPLAVISEDRVEYLRAVGRQGDMLVIERGEDAQIFPAGSVVHITLDARTAMEALHPVVEVNDEPTDWVWPEPWEPETPDPDPEIHVEPDLAAVVNAFNCGSADVQLVPGTQLLVAAAASHGSLQRFTPTESLFKWGAGRSSMADQLDTGEARNAQGNILMIGDWNTQIKRTQTPEGVLWERAVTMRLRMPMEGSMAVLAVFLERLTGRLLSAHLMQIDGDQMGSDTSSVVTQGFDVPPGMQPDEAFTEDAALFFYSTDTVQPGDDGYQDYCDRS